jgi:hypothetical protein
MEHDFARLKAHILPLSRSKSFELARREWGLVSIEISREFGNCPCGHPIKDYCVIRNRLTGNNMSAMYASIDSSAFTRPTYLRALEESLETRQPTRTRT